MLDSWLAVLVAGSLKAAALCLAAGAAALLLRRASAAARHLVWRLAFAGLLALPVLAALLPAWEVAVPRLPRREEAAAETAGSNAAAPVRLADRQRAPVADSPAAHLSLPAATEPLGARLPWQALLLGIWMTGAGALLAVLLAAHLRVRRVRRLAQPLDDEAWRTLLRSAGADLGTDRPVALLAGDERAMPMSWGWRRPVVLLPAGAADWPEARRRAVLLHELAHIARGDYLAQIAAEVACALHWFNPLVWVAARRLRLESEHACDDRVLSAGASASDYAGDLLEIARSLRTHPALAPAGLAMARPSQLSTRLLAVLDGGRDRRTLSRRLVLPAWLVAACVAVPLAAFTPGLGPVAEGWIGGPAAEGPRAMVASAKTTAAASPAGSPRTGGHRVAPPAPPAPPKPPAPPRQGGSSKARHRSANISVNGVSTYQWSQDDRRVKIRTEGKFELTDDWTGIARLERGAEMRFEEEVGRAERRLDVEAGDGGRPVFTWKVNGQERAFDAEGRKWLQAMLLDFVRGSGYDAERRAAWFLKNRGADGLLAEISQIPGDYGKRIYYQALFATRGLSPDVVRRALAQAGREIRSDYDLAESLEAAAKSQALQGATALAYVEATRSLESDYDHRRALIGLLSKNSSDPATAAAALRSASTIRSDYDLAEVLTAVAAKNALEGEAVQRAYAEAAAEIGSDYDSRRALSAAVERGDLSEPALLTVLRASLDIGSDYDRATLLVAVAERYQLSGAARGAYLKAAGSIGSEYDRQRAEAALGRSGR